MSPIKMNKYITALLVVLATTGVEAQSYQSALKMVLGDVAIEGLYQHGSFNDLKSNIQDIIKSLNQKDADKKTKQTKKYNFAHLISLPLCHIEIYSKSPKNILQAAHLHAYPASQTSIFIRGPNTHSALS